MNDIRTLYVFSALLLLVGCTSSHTMVDNKETRQLAIEDLAFMRGSWTGELVYLNYGDDKTRVALPTRAVYSQDAEAISYQLIFTEPNGDEVKGDGQIKIDERGNVRYNGASHMLVDHTKTANGDVQIKLTRRGKDNNRDARIDHVIQSNEDSLTITRYVLLDGTSESFVRHTYTFSREG